MLILFYNIIYIYFSLYSSEFPVFTNIFHNSIKQTHGILTIFASNQIFKYFLLRNFFNLDFLIKYLFSKRLNYCFWYFSKFFTHIFDDLYISLYFLLHSLLINQKLCPQFLRKSFELLDVIINHKKVIFWKDFSINKDL